MSDAEIPTKKLWGLGRAAQSVQRSSVWKTISIDTMYQELNRSSR